jgi:uncharacterized membrane protein YedE/YeeE
MARQIERKSHYHLHSRAMWHATLPQSRLLAMTIDWSAFTPWPAVIGGVVIGLAAALLVLVNGRVAGVSGIMGGLLRPRGGDFAWRLAFIAGLLAAPWTCAVAGLRFSATIDAGYPALIVAGLLVGIGTRYAGGCTSGHGVCGLSRMSPRSLVATLAFMAAGFVVVYVLHHVVAA